jgi:branched-chain amino acid transport system permease protein
MTTFVQYVIDGVFSGSLYVLLALGFTLVFGVMGIMNVAHADLYMLAAFTFVWVSQDAGLGPVLGFLAGAGAAVVTGYLIFIIVLRRVERTATVALFVSTLGVSYVLENLVAKIVDFQERSVTPVFETQLWRIGGDDGIRITNGDALVFVATLAMGLALLLWLRSSETGRLLRAVSESPGLAQIVGIDTGRMMGIAIVLASLIAGVGGLLVANQTQGIDPFVANDVSLKMFAVAVVAGVGSVGGAIVVGFSLGAIESLTVAYIGSTWQSVIGLLAMVIVLLFRPQGLFGRYNRVG